MMTKHTPGPWEATPNGGDDPDPTIRYISTPDNLIAVSEKIWWAGDWDIEQQEANARLIAAAPDLLEVVETGLGLRDYEKEHPRVVNWPKWEAEARAAIAKAKGER